MSRKVGSLSIVLIATATASLMLGAGASAQYAAGDAQKSTQKPGASSAAQPAGDRGQAKPATATAGDRAQTKGASSVKVADKNFLTHASQDGEAEVELGRLAQQKAADAQVKAFGQRMETDHSKAGSELRALIAQKGVTVPGGLTPPHLALKNRLDKLQGATFDQAYMREMVTGHTKAVREFETASKSTDPDVKAFAEKTLPTLREHLKMAQDTNKSLSSTSTSRTSSTGMGTKTGGSSDSGAKTGGTSGTQSGTGSGGTRSGTGTGTGSPRSGTGTGSTGTTQPQTGK